MILPLLVLAQAGANLPPAWEMEAIRPYEDCVEAAAKELALSDAPNADVEYKAVNACGNSKVIAQIQIKAHYILDAHRQNDDLFQALYDGLPEAAQKKIVDDVANSKLDELVVAVRRGVRARLEGRKR